MAQFYTGDQDMVSAFAHGETHPGTTRYIEDMIAQPTYAIGAASQQLMQQTGELYERFMGSQAVRRIRAAGRQIASHWQRNEILPLETTGSLQTAPVKMQRWLMAEPSIRSLYHKRQCDGYSDSYVDAAPGFIGAEHEDYQRVMNGIVVENPNASEHEWSTTEYLHDLPEDEREFIFEEQFDILRSWHTLAEAVMAKDDDPTSRWNAEL
jgi:hypothetical protein